MRRTSYRFRYSLFFLLPALAVYLVFQIGPIAGGVFYAFTDWTSSSGNDVSFIGLTQFRRILELDYFGLAVFNTVLFTVATTLFKVLFGLLLALGLNQAFRSRTVIRGLLFAPTLINNLVLGLIFKSLLAPNGILNAALRVVGLGFLAHNWLVEPGLAMHSVNFMEIWKWSGQMMLIFLAGLQGVPEEYYEAADMDGATAGQKFFRVTLPLIRPSLNINLLLGVVWGIRVFDMVYALTSGGPGRSTETLNTMVFESLGKGFYGFGAAINLLIVAAIIIVAIPLMSMLRREETEL